MNAVAVALVSIVSPIITGGFGTVMLIAGEAVQWRHRWLGAGLVICCAISLWAALRALNREL